MSNIDRFYYDKVQTHLLESAEVKRHTVEKCMNSTIVAAKLIADTFRSGGKVLLCGNGGSAADCQHMASEFVNLLNKDFNRSGLPAVALTTDTAFITAFANDFSFEGVFERQVQALGKSGDLLIGISTSGNSQNVIRAVKAAKSANMRTIVLTGNSGALKRLTKNVVIAVPSINTQYIQEAHLTIEHILCELVEYHLFSAKKSRKAKSYGYK